MNAFDAAARAACLFGAARVLLGAIHDVKLHGRGTPPGLAAVDRIAALVACVAVGVAAAQAAWAGAVLGAACALVVAALWLDALMYRAFTIELGARATVGALVLPVLWREVTGLASSRAFVRAHRAFLAAPIAGAAAVACAVAPSEASLVVAGALLALQVRFVDPDARGAAHGAYAAFLLGGFAVLSARPSFVVAAAWALAAASTRTIGAGEPRPHLAWFFRRRHVVAPPGFVPRPEHAALLAEPARAAPRSARFGACRGADVVVLSVESLGRDHLARYAPGGAVTPFLDGVVARGASSARHVSPVPMTNDAHVAWYFGAHARARGAPGLAPLRAAGWRALYATTAHVAHYGLADVLDEAGFDAVLDAASFDPARGDRALAERLPALLAERLGARRPDERVYLHVHTADTHVPYVVRDRTRFARFPQDDDEGRFKDGVEEADDVLGALLAELVRRGVLIDPVVVVTSDHGQAFGAKGYRSHGSGLVGEQILCPFAVAHPALAPWVAPSSSHFDLLPTVIDLAGVDAPPCAGASLFADAPRAPLVVSAGKPSVATTSCFGWLLGDEKVVVDLVLDRVVRSGWNDEAATELAGDEKDYALALAAAAHAGRGLT